MIEKQKLSFSPIPLSPVRIRPNLHHSGPLPVQHLQGIGQIEEVELHVDRCWWILPGIKRLCAILQNDFLWGTEGSELLILHIWEKCVTS